LCGRDFSVAHAIHLHLRPGITHPPGFRLVPMPRLWSNPHFFKLKGSGVVYFWWRVIGYSTSLTLKSQSPPSLALPKPRALWTVNPLQKALARTSSAISFFSLLKPCQFSAPLQTAPNCVRQTRPL